MVKKLLVTIGIAFLAGLIDPAPADAAEFEVTPMIGYTAGGAFQDEASGAFFEIDEGRNVGIALDIKQTDDQQLEVYYNRQHTRLRSGGGLFVGNPLFDLDVQYFHLGGTYGTGEEHFRPFAVGTFGATHMAPKGKSLEAETKLSFSLGGGVKLMPTDRAGMRLEARWFGTFIDGAGALFCAGGTCELAVSGDIISQFIVNAGLIVAF